MLSKKPWQAMHVLVFCGTQFFGLCLFMIIATVFQAAHFSGFKQTDDFGFLVCGTLGVQGVTWILMPFFLHWHQVGWREAFGLNNPRWGRSLLLAAGVLLLTLPLVWLLENLCVAALTQLGHPPDNQRAVDMFLNAKTVLARSYFVFFAIVLAPVAEEFIFRGVLYPFIKERGWPCLAFFGSSALFAFIHFDLATFIPLFALALVLTGIYEKTNCLLASITAHSLFNTSNLLLLAYQPQIVDFFQKHLHIQLNP